MTTKNDVTGDLIKSKVNNKAFEENFVKYFGERKTNGGYKPPEQPKPEPAEEISTDWDEKRIDIIGQNGPTGEHYPKK